MPAAELDAANPLLDLHRSAEAEFQDYAGVEMVSTFGEPQAEYAAVRKAAALFDWPQRGVIELAGPDRLPFLNNLLSNQTFDKNAKTPMPTGSSVYAFLLNNKSGRILCDLFVLELGDRTLLELDARQVPEILITLEKYRFVEKVTMADRRADLHVLALHGPTGAAALGSAAIEMKPNDVASVELFGVPVVLRRDDVASVPGFNLIVPSALARTVWMNLLSPSPGTPGEGRGEGESERKVSLDILHQPRQKPPRPAGWAAFNATRIEGGRPLFGIDFDDTILPAETSQLSRAVSFTKGCYPGQEIVARMHARGAWAKQLVGLRMADDSLPMAGSIVQDGAGNAIGGVTSSTISPVLSNIGVAIALVKKAHSAIGTVLKVPADGAMRAVVVAEMPFVRAG